MVIRTKSGVAKWTSANGLCARATIVNGRASSAISAPCRQVTAHTGYSFGGDHGAAPGAS